MVKLVNFLTPDSWNFFTCSRLQVVEFRPPEIHTKISEQFYPVLKPALWCGYINWFCLENCLKSCLNSLIRKISVKTKLKLDWKWSEKWIYYPWIFSFESGMEWLYQNRTGACLLIFQLQLIFSSFLDWFLDWVFFASVAWP